MARALAVGAASSASNPVLDLWTLVAGALANVTAVTFTIYDLSTGAPVLVTGPTAATALSTGRYLAPWTAVLPAGRHRVVWAVTFPDATTATYQYDFDVLAAGLSLKGPAYCLLSDLRDEGFTTTALPDARALMLIRRVSVLIERWTRRFFEPRYMTFTLDGARGPTQFLQDPIIAVDSVKIDEDLVDPESYEVFNRHIAERLTNPDDRDNPRLTFNRIMRTLQRLDVYDRPYSNRAIFWPGARNVKLAGLFGYTDPDVDLQVGVTPELIKMAAMMLVQRSVTTIASSDPEDALAGRIKSVRTRDQSVEYDRSDLESSGGDTFSGDPTIDSILAQYVAPPFIGSA